MGVMSGADLGHTVTEVLTELTELTECGRENGFRTEDGRGDCRGLKRGVGSGLGVAAVAPWREILSAGLGVRLGLGQVHHAAALFPETALLEQVDALETFENVALGCNGTG